MSDAPSPSSFGYTFDGLADVIERLLLKELGLERFGLFVQGYGGPVGFRIATRHPERIGWPVVQNSTEAPLRGFLTPSAARWIYTEVARDPGHVNPDTWVVDLAALARPEGDRIQLDLFYDDGTNVAQYPEWQAYLRTQKPPTLVVWGKNDPIFTPEGAHAFQPDLPEAELHLLDTGHFAPEEDLETIAALMKDFYARCVRGATRRGSRTAAAV